jgi:CheY-like chemotaxis protein
LADFAHDVRTPLTGIVALADLLAASPLGDREKRWVAALRSSAQHLAALTTLVVDSARTDGAAVRDETFDPDRLAREIADGFAVRAEANGLACVVTLADDLPHRARGDSVRLRAALENLVDNAVKFTSRGEVRFRVSGARLARGRARLAFAVSDSGIGLSAKEIARLFRPFRQASDDVAARFGGSGLGLFLVKNFAKQMGGDVKVESKPGVGSTFTLSIVVADADFRSASVGKAPKLHSLRVLCVDDNAYSRMALGAVLRELGHVTEFATSGEAATEMLRKDGFDLVLLDVMLAGIDGLETTRRIRALPPPAGTVPIIGISGREETAAPAREAGMSAYLVKPISPKDLLDAIKAVIGDR